MVKTENQLKQLIERKCRVIPIELLIGVNCVPSFLFAIVNSNPNCCIIFFYIRMAQWLEHSALAAKVRGSNHILAERYVSSLDVGYQSAQL